MRVSVNLLGNCVATLVVANWEGQLHKGRMRKVLDGEDVPPLAEPDPMGGELTQIPEEDAITARPRG
jgi:aerobic C4-dicarboxylate transport protein